MTLSQLRYFVEVCRWGNNITRAGEELHISQPSISNAIKDLEQEFGVLLFKRTLRELIVALCGLLLPVAAFSYLRWAFGEPFEEVVVQLAEQCRPAETGWIYVESSFAGFALSVVLALLVLGGAAAHAVDRYACSTKARAILAADFWLLAACASVPFLAGPSVVFLPLIAVPASVLIPFLFVRLRAAFANLLYLLVLALALLHLFL